MKNIRLSIPMVFNPEMVEFYASCNKKYYKNSISIKEVYGSLDKYTARESYRLPNISLGQLIGYAEKLKKFGIDFNYTLNSTMLDMNDIRDSIFPLVEMLKKSGIYTFTVSSSLLLHQLHNKYPDLKLVLSTIAGADSIRKIKQAKLSGVSRVILDLKVSRNFNLMKNLSAVKNINYLELQNWYPVCHCEPFALVRRRGNPFK